MTKQEELKNAIAKKCEVIWYSHDIDGIWGIMAGRIIEYLHSQGVVIKVDRELHPLLQKQGPHKEFAERDLQQRLQQAGYVAVEPLLME